MGALIRIGYILALIVIAPFIIPIACYQNRQTLWGWAYYFDNDEDGFDGSKLGWYDEYLGVDISSLAWHKRAWIAYKWSMRNPCFNLRKHPLVGVDVTSPVRMEYSGNTFFHSRDWTYTKEPNQTLWYKLSANYNGKRYTSRFYLIPVGKYDLYLRFGLKIYPRHYFDKYWIDRIKNDGWPVDKKYGLSAITIRVRKNPLK